MRDLRVERCLGFMALGAERSLVVEPLKDLLHHGLRMLRGLRHGSEHGLRLCGSLRRCRRDSSE
jgi:hypothetical protein